MKSVGWGGGSLFGLILISSATLAATQAPVVVFTEKVGPKPIFTVLTFPARVESKVNAIIRSEADGAVSSIAKPLGSRVHRGDTIAVIRHTDPVYEFAPMAVVASVSGVVNEVHVTPGSLVNKGDSIVTVTDPKQLRVVIEVAALDLESVRAGLKGELSIAGMDQPLEAQVRGVSPSIDPMLGTASCELSVNLAAQKQIISGMVGKIQFKVNQHQGIILPDYAIVYRGEKTFVRLVNGGKSNRVAVKLGFKSQGQVEILSGLKAGDEVIDRANRFVGEGDSVQVETARE